MNTAKKARTDAVVCVLNNIINLAPMPWCVRGSQVDAERSQIYALWQAFDSPLVVTAPCQYLVYQNGTSAWNARFTAMGALMYGIAEVVDIGDSNFDALWKGLEIVR
jgi:hypothetical protein